MGILALVIVLAILLFPMAKTARERGARRLCVGFWFQGTVFGFVSSWFLWGWLTKLGGW